MKNGEIRDMNATMQSVWQYLTEHVEEEVSFISYLVIRDAVGKRSRHAIAYAVEKLRRSGKIRIYDRKIHVVEPYQSEG